MTRTLHPPLTPPGQLTSALREHGLAVLDAAAMRELLPASPTELDALRPSWGDLPPDNYLRDGGHYRRRRHSCFIVDEAAVRLVAHRAHWQPLEYNALHGGLERWFEPIEARLIEAPAWTALLRLLVAQASAL